MDLPVSAPPPGIEMRHILCPTDFSAPSARAFEHALALVAWYRAPVTVLHVLSEPAGLPAALPYPYAPALLDGSLRAGVEVDLASLVGPARRAGLHAVAEVREGHPATQTVRMAHELGADLIVMGTHGRSGLERLFLGSVAETVLRRAPCPVLTVPPRARDEADPLFFKSILCATDFSPASEAAVRYATALAAEADASLYVAHVLDRPGMPARAADEAAPGRDADFGTIALARLRRAVAPEARDWFRVREVVSRGPAAEQILRLAARYEVGLIVMGVHGRSLLDLMAFGSVTHHVVREASCPVLTVRPPGR